MHSVRVLLCNHHPIIRSGLRQLLERNAEIRVVGEAANAREAIGLDEYLHPSVVLLDLDLPYRTGITAAIQISAKKRNTGVIFLSAHADQEYVGEAFQSGARGFVLSDSVQTDLIRAVRVVATDGRFLSPTVAAKLIDEYVSLSENDKNLFCLLAQGYDRQEIARYLNASFEHVNSRCEAANQGLSYSHVPAALRYCIGESFLRGGLNSFEAGRAP